MIQAKLNKLVDAQVLLRSTFLKALLTPAKIFSPVTQKDQPNIEIVDAVEKNRREVSTRPEFCVRVAFTESSYN